MDDQNHIHPRFRTKSRDLFSRESYSPPKIKSERTTLIIECADWRKRLKQKGYNTPSDRYMVWIPQKVAKNVFTKPTARVSVMNIRKLNQATKVNRSEFSVKRSVDFDTFLELDKASNQ